MTGSPSGLVAATIVSKNYLPFARVLARSFLEHHPGGRLVVLLVDRVEGRFDPAAEPFEVLEVEELAGRIPDLGAFLFKYTVLEINTAVKPYFLAHLLAQEGVEKLIYFDPDIRLFQPLDELSALLDRHRIVVTPHLTRPIDDAHHPSEMSILQAGTYNLGFLALARSEAAGRLLAWWQERIYEHCVVDIAKGLFVDQKWIDLAPGLFEGVHVLTHPGYNVAYWNLHGRRVTLEGDPAAARVDGEPLVFFHFSGIDPDDPGRVSKHQDRFTLGTLGEGARRLYLAYREELLAAGFHDTRSWSYAFGRFDNGVAIPDVARSLYFSLGSGRGRFGDPFGAAGGGSFFAWANGPVRPAAPGEPYLSRLLEHLHRSRPDLLRELPDPHGRDLPRFALWLAEGGSREYRLGEAFLEPVAALTAPPARPGAAAASQVRRTVRRTGASPLGRKVKRYLKRALGPERAAAWKRRLPGRAGGAVPAADREPFSQLAISRFGVNVAGYITTESGMGEGVRGVIRALEHAGIPHALQNLELGVASRMEDRSFGAFSSVFDYDVNLFFVNADQVPHVAAHLGRERFRRKINVGFWLWELEELPRRWRSSFDYFHEVWTPSRFCLDALSGASPIPVRRVGLPVEVAPVPAPDRARFGLPADRFVFLFAFDFLSYFERKNPLALVRAFKRAFRPQERALLVLKTINAGHHPEGAARVRREAEGWPVLLLDEYLSKDEVHQLMAASDAYVSLHRSEGFGLTLAEAMCLGKPVVATDYSGSTDFLNAGNGFPVRYELVDVEAAEGPYEPGNRWAEPDEGHAAELMRRLYEQPEEARRMGERGRREMAARHGVAATAAVLRRRLKHLLLEVNGVSGDHFGL